jgi:hypothetical protein
MESLICGNDGVQVSGLMPVFVCCLLAQINISAADLDDELSFSILKFPRLRQQPNRLLAVSGKQGIEGGLGHQGTLALA